jgi:predicted DNA-binding transcriptional regulator YafY
VVLEFMLGDTHELIRWVLSFGQHAEVLTPNHLAKQLQEQLRKALKRYQQRS